MRHDVGQQPPHQPVFGRAAALLFDFDPRHVDEVHVVDTARTRRHARQARQATIDMMLHLGVGPAPFSNMSFIR